MGASNDIRDTNISQALIGKICRECEKPFSEKDICEEANWEIDWDCTDPCIISEKIDSENKPTEKYYATITVRGFYHKFCDEHTEDEPTEKKSEIKTNSILGNGRVGLYGIDIVMDNLRQAQLKHIERMKEKEEETTK